MPISVWFSGAISALRSNRTSPWLSAKWKVESRGYPASRRDILDFPDLGYRNFNEDMQ
jgi:hypothetical protein